MYGSTEQPSGRMGPSGKYLIVGLYSGIIAHESIDKQMCFAAMYM